MGGPFLWFVAVWWWVAQAAICARRKNPLSMF